LTNGALSDLNLADILYYHMIGGPKSAVADMAGGLAYGYNRAAMPYDGSSSGVGVSRKICNSFQVNKVMRVFFSLSHFKVREGDTINIDVTGPGATLALGLMFFDSGNASVAAWMDAPATQHLLEFVRPDFLMLRTMAKGLILWSDISPTSEWLESHVPEAIRPYCMVRPDPEMHPRGLDYETINQAYCNIVSGAALVMGIRFAGSHNAQAFDVRKRSHVP